jgi:hypothetical protein
MEGEKVLWFKRKKKFYGSSVRKRKTITDNNAKDKVKSLNLQTDRKRNK